MSVNADNIEIGEGVLYVKASGEAAWTDVGACQGAELAAVQEFQDVECGQVLAAITTFPVMETCKFKVKMLEHTTRNLATALNLHPQSGWSSSGAYDQVIFGNDTDTTWVAFKYVQEQQADTTKNFQFQSNRSAVQNGLSFTFDKKTERIFEIEFCCFPDTDDSNRLLYIHRDA